MAKCGKCDPHEICEECPEWIFTLADLIMCMMGLFVILWVLKPSPTPQKPEMNEEWIKVAAAVREAFGYLPDPNSKDPVDIHMLLKKLQEMDPLKGPGDGGKTKLPRKAPEGTDVESTTIRTGKVSVEGGKLTFAAGQSALPPAMAQTLDQVADLIRGHRNIILVKGHTSLDDFGESGTAEQKMDLSLRRAQAVADYLVTKRVEPDILRVQGCSTFEPVSRGNYTPEAMTMNRRVEVEATPTLVEDRQDKARAATSIMRPADPKSAEAGADVRPAH